MNVTPNQEVWLQVFLPEPGEVSQKRGHEQSKLSMASSWSDAPPEEARALDVWPLDESNVKLLDAVRPRAWEGPTEAEAAGEYDIIAIGSGAGGLVTAKQAARRGARSALISGHLAGGDCLNVGCVPSKALLHCARAAREARAALAEGFLVAADGTAPKLEVDFDAVMARMRRLRAHIAPADSHEGSAAAGAHVYQGWARFSGPDTVVVNERTLRFKKCVIATGGRAAVPPTPGLAAAPYVTNATLYNLTALPPRMVVLGAGVIGMEMAQARRLGVSRLALSADLGESSFSSPAASPRPRRSPRAAAGLRRLWLSSDGARSLGGPVQGGAGGARGGRQGARGRRRRLRVGRGRQGGADAAAATAEAHLQRSLKSLGTVP